jgi:ribosomal protein S18 acetylase RimI-like enzyme
MYIIDNSYTKGELLEMSELYNIFKQNFPLCTRNVQIAQNILNSKANKIFEMRNNAGELIAVSVINKNNILMLCVNKQHRNQGIGSKLLQKSEEYIKQQGYTNITIGVGDEYLMPGVPSKNAITSEHMGAENIYPNLEDYVEFFKKRGYIHKWDCNCFDMRMLLDDFAFDEISIPTIIDGIEYDWAKYQELDGINACVGDAHEPFVKYYQNSKLYQKNNHQRVLVAKINGEIVGTIIISINTEGNDLGSVGCTTVMHKYRGKHIGVNLTKVATKHVKDCGLKHGFLGYTYSGMDTMYGYSGYKICTYYFMATKQL